MENLYMFEASYQKFIHNLKEWLPEGVVDVDLTLLHHFNLLEKPDKETEESLTRCFHVFETDEKITLVNHQFVIWIVPENMQDGPKTYTLIATKEHDSLHLEVAFATAGVYNTSRMVLRVLEKFLEDIQENEELVKNYKKTG